MKTRYKSIYGWSTDQEQGELIRRIVPLIPSKINMVEIGSFYGRTTVLICDELVNHRIVYNYTAIDNYTNTKHADIIQRMENACNDTGAELIQGDLSKAEKFKDLSLDVVYIDCSDVAKFKGIIKAWLPKLKNNGILCGNMQDPAIRTAISSLFEEWDWVSNQFYTIKKESK